MELLTASLRSCKTFVDRKKAVFALFHHHVSAAQATIIDFSILFSRFYFCSLRVNVILSDSPAAAPPVEDIVTLWSHPGVIHCNQLSFCTNTTKILIVTMHYLFYP